MNLGFHNPKQPQCLQHKGKFNKNNFNLGGRFGYFLFFLLFRGRGKGGRVRGEKGGYFYLKIEKGGCFEGGRRGGAHRRWEGVSGRGGQNIFFRGQNVHQDDLITEIGLKLGKNDYKTREKPESAKQRRASSFWDLSQARQVQAV